MLDIVQSIVVVRHIAQEAFRTVKLFKEHNAGQLMRKGLRTKGNEVFGLVGGV